MENYIKKDKKVSFLIFHIQLTLHLLILYHLKMILIKYYFLIQDYHIHIYPKMKLILKSLYNSLSKKQYLTKVQHY